ncbi:DUF2846 domain-containing protein [Candidatus Sulfurimonas marisnigri]|uniref:DUF2846 domain-containing protein n=1 Tax=Candidatus Sulfurimonas marisnigri TaxID=2740405 RepID=A0A7S7M0R1_9BACT|nr:DUF2846 domain-containing protein [Candidatus Sulfurimonas marisnigri]QOY54909.1 DUF2846 domain-containing protein [Candidatus Sulfurimonas marisnigri]
MRKVFILKAVLLIGLVLVFTGCGKKALPPVDVMEKEVAGFTLPKLPEEGKALVYVVRPEFLGMAIKFNVYIDDKMDSSEMGYTKGQEYIYFNVTPGKHKILSLAENWDAIDIDLKAGDIVFLEQEPKMGVLYARNKLYGDIGILGGKYRVKTLSIGNIKKLDK